MAYLLPQLLTQNARRHPDHTAVVCDGASCTYGELAQRSDQLAGVLQQAGVVRGDRVGVYLEKSIEAVIALFGIMKAGAAYVPLDPAAPVRRVTYIIDNCAMKALVTTQTKVNGLAEAGPLAASVQYLVLTDAQLASQTAQPLRLGWSTVLAAPTAPPPDPQLVEDDLAYILYTSGSTGVPKGVMISHRASLTFVDWATACFALQPTDRVANHAPFHFDLSIFDLFATLQAGGTVILVPGRLALFPRSLAQWIAEERISVWYSVPSALTRLVLYGGLDDFDCSQLRLVLFAGEVFPIKHLRTLMAHWPQAAYYNLYGPTETNVCTWYGVRPLDLDRTEPLPIGQACANSEVFVLDEAGQVAPPGQVGELCVRGPGLMKGYWGLPDRTQLVLHPYVLHKTLGPELIYHTGDLVQQAADGNFIYLGRRDNQIKSRGYRIELGEIERGVLCPANPQVHDPGAD
jgi:amino acid adenylation domain-containing protein